MIKNENTKCLKCLLKYGSQSYYCIMPYLTLSLFDEDEQLGEDYR